MSPTADSASPPAQISTVAAEELLDGGEVILLAIKPSGWFVLLSSWPVVAVAGVVAAGAFLAGSALPAWLPKASLYLLCLALLGLRLLFACAQWVGRLYLLTNRRVMCIQGVIRVHIEDRVLKQIQRTAVAATSAERLVSVGSLLFEDVDGKTLDLAWLCLSRPGEVQEAVEDAIRRAS